MNQQFKNTKEPKIIQSPISPDPLILHGSEKKCIYGFHKKLSEF